MKIILVTIAISFSFFSSAQELDHTVIETIFNQPEVLTSLNEVHKGKPDIIFNSKGQVYRFIQKENASSEVVAQVQKISNKNDKLKVKIKVEDLLITSSLQRELNDFVVASVLIKGKGVTRYSKNF